MDHRQRYNTRPNINMRYINDGLREKQHAVHWQYRGTNDGAQDDNRQFRNNGYRSRHGQHNGQTGREDESDGRRPHNTDRGRQPTRHSSMSGWLADEDQGNPSREHSRRRDNSRHGQRRNPWDNSTPRAQYGRDHSRDGHSNTRSWGNRYTEDALTQRSRAPRRDDSEERYDPNQKRSTNGDFKTMIKLLFRAVQLQHQRLNWESFPRSIRRDLNRLKEGIKPADPTTELAEELEKIFDSTEGAIHKCVLDHLQRRIQSNADQLTTLNPQDKERAKKLVYYQLRDQMGKKLGEAILQSELEDAYDLIGASHGTRQQTEMPQRAKRTREEGTPPSAPTRKVCVTERRPSRIELSTSETAAHIEAETNPPSEEMEAEDLIQRDHWSETEEPNGARIFHTGALKSTWKVDPVENKDILVISDDTLDALTERAVPTAVQLNTFPGAQFKHVAGIIERLPTETPTRSSSRWE
jgi:hypothetical protein